MENCVAPGLDEFDVIIRSCIVFSQSISISAFCKSKLFLFILISHITQIMKKLIEMQMVHSKLISISS